MTLSHLRGPGALPVAELTRLAGAAPTAAHAQGLIESLGRTARSALGPGVEVCVALGDPLAPEAVATTAHLAQALDGAQLRAGEGPAPAAYATGGVVHSDRLADDPRWPRLAAGVPAGVIGCVVAPLRAVVGDADDQPGVLGVLGVCAVREAVGELVGLVEVLAAVAAGAVRELTLRGEVAQLRHHLAHAEGSRAVIEQAKGIVMAHRGGGPEEAFAHLVRLSSQQERKLRDVARAVVDGAQV